MWNIAGGVNRNIVKNIIIKLNHIKPGLFSSTFDCYSNLHWHGGRNFNLVPIITPDKFISRIKELNKHGIGFYYTFSNHNITKNDLDDYWCNYFIEQTHNEKNGIICGNAVLVDYIRKKYPLFKIIGSVTLQERNVERIKQLQQIYDILVLPTELNRNYELIEKLDTSRIEILVSEICFADCKVKKKHYTLMNNWNYTHDITDLIALIKLLESPSSCLRRNITECNPYTHRLKKSEIEKLKSIGVKTFKLLERNNLWLTLENIFKFIILYSDESLIKKGQLSRALPCRRLFLESSRSYIFRFMHKMHIYWNNLLKEH